jgi:uncharacterized protein
MPMEYLVVLFPRRRRVMINSQFMGYTNKKLELEGGNNEVSSGPPSNFKPAQLNVDLSNTSAMMPMIDDREKYPAILIRTPYNKYLSGSYGYLPAYRAAFEGYAIIIQDTRGRFASEGEFMPMSPEGPDGYDTIETIAAESWCDGNIGMAGGSYLGRVQWEAAMEDPPHLKAIAPAIISSGPLSETRRRGLVDLEQSISWFGAMAIDMIEKMGRDGKDITEMRRKVGYALLNLEEACRYLPLKDLPYFNFEGLSEGFAARIGEGALDGLKSEEDLYWKYGKVKVPCFHAGGWYDLFLGGLFENFLNMRKKGGSKEAREGQHVLCGPWAHGAGPPGPDAPRKTK